MSQSQCVWWRSFDWAGGGGGEGGEEHDEAGAGVHETYAMHVALGEARREVHEADGEDRDAGEQCERAARPTQEREPV